MEVSFVNKTYLSCEAAPAGNDITMVQLVLEFSVSITLPDDRLRERRNGAARLFMIQKYDGIYKHFYIITKALSDDSILCLPVSQ